MRSLKIISLLGLLLSQAALLHSQTLTVKVNNQTGKNVLIMLHGSGSSDGKLQNDVAERLSAGNQNFTIASGSGLARIYFSFNKAVTVGEPFNSKTRFDWVELTYVPPGVSQANLTAVDQFGIPMTIVARTGNNAVIGKRGWSVSGNKIIAQLAALAPKAQVKSGGNFVRIQAPPHTPSAYPSVAPYFKSLKGQKVVLSDVFSMAGQDPIFFKYSGTFSDASGSIVLAGTMTQGGKPYSQNFSVSLRANGAVGTRPVDQFYPANGPYYRSDTGNTPHTAGENNVYSVIYRDLLSGLNNGYIGGKYGNNSDKWKNKPGFAAARGEPNDGFYDQYAEKISNLSKGTVYGFAFSDNVSEPLLTITNAATLTINLLSDSANP